MNEILTNINEAFYKIAEDAKRYIQYVMESDKGINIKVNENTLVDSNIYNEIDIEVKDLSLINIFVNDYIDAIEEGRKAHSRLVPIEVLAEWASRKNITNDNNVIYAIQRAIYNDGIPARPIMPTVYEHWDEAFEIWVEDLINTIFYNLDDFFNN